MLSRRELLGKLITYTPAVIIAAPVVKKNIWQFIFDFKPKIVIEQIKTSLMYRAIGKKLLMVDELPQGTLPRYERDYD